MKIFVAGATGVLGRATVPLMVEAGHEVRGVARTSAKADQLRAQGAEAVLGVDLLDPTGLRGAVEGAEAVVHMATSIPPAWKAWRTKAWAMNDRLRREGTKTLADAARDAGAARFVKETVCFFYSPQGDRWIDEESPVEETSFSSASLDAERTTMAFAEEGRAAVVLRFGLFYSAEARSTQESLLAARAGFGPTIGRPDAYQPSIHLDDAAAAVVAALDAPTGIYNVADEPITKGEWNRAFFEAFGIAKTPKANPKVMEAALGEKGQVLAGSRRVTSQKFREATGWEPKFADAALGLKAVAAESRARR